MNRTPRSHAHRPVAAFAVLVVALTGVAAANATGATPTDRPLPTAVAKELAAPILAAATFANPPASARPKYRWWMPGADTTKAELSAELAQMKQAGAGGAEISPFSIPGAENRTPAQLAKDGWGSPAWQRRVLDMYGAAQKNGLVLDQTLGGSGTDATMVPMRDGLNDPATSKMLVYGSATVAAGQRYDAALPTSSSVPTVSTTLCPGNGAGDTHLHLFNTNSFAVGDTVTLGAGTNAESVRITAIGGGNSGPCSVLTLAASAESRQIYPAATDFSTFKVGSRVTVGSGPSAETGVISSVGRAPTATTLFSAAAAGDANVKVASTGTVDDGDLVQIGAGESLETRTVTDVGTAGGASSLTAAAATGDTTVTALVGLFVNATTIPLGPTYAAGATLTLGTGASTETREIATVSAPTMSGTVFGLPAVVQTLTLSTAVTGAFAAGSPISTPGTGITVNAPLASSHPAGDAVLGVGGGIALRRALTKAHPVGTLVRQGALGAGVTITPALTQPRAPGQIVTTTAKTTLIAAEVAQCENTCAETPPALVESTLRTVTDQVHAGALDWTAPASGHPWVVIGFYQTSDTKSLQVTADQPDYFVDHLSQLGADTLIRYFNAHIFTPQVQAIVTKIRKYGVPAVFEDSLEYAFTQKWTGDFAAQFNTRRGYSVTDALPVIAGSGFSGLGTGAFQFGGSDSAMRQDYRQTWSDLYVTQYLQPLEAWAESRGLVMRAQSYNFPMDTSYAASSIGIPEGEGLEFNNDPATYNVVAVGAHMSGTPIVSTECCAAAGKSYAETAAGSGNYLNDVYNAFAGGVNQVVWHGFPYATAPHATWPGYHPWSVPADSIDFGEAWGPRDPQWGAGQIRAINDAVARLSLTLRQGKPRYDLAVYRADLGQAMMYSPPTPPSPALTGPFNSAGYTTEFISPQFLTDPTKATWNGTALFPNQSAYKGLILNDQTSMPLDVARRILALCEEGMPLVVIGDLPSTIPGYDAGGQDDAVMKISARIAALENDGNPAHHVVHVADAATAVTALSGLNVGPAAAPATSTRLLTVRRHTADTDYYYLDNSTGTAVDQTVTLTGNGTPYQLDSWAGKITRLAQWTASSGHVTVPVHVGAYDQTVIAISTRNLDGTTNPVVHILTTTAPQTAVHGSGVLLRSTSAGTYQARLSTGQTVTRTFTVPAPQTLNTWRLQVQSWHPAADVTATTNVTHIAKTTLPPITVTAGADGTLPSWAHITDPVNLQDVSGIGTYRTTIALPSSWSGGHGAYLDLGAATDTVSLRVNGHAVSVDEQDYSRTDIGAYLHSGNNAIVVTVASTLNNAVRVAPGDTAWAARPRQDYGLLGPVRLIPYGQATA